MTRTVYPAGARRRVDVNRPRQHDPDPRPWRVTDADGSSQCYRTVRILGESWGVAVGNGRWFIETDAEIHAEK